MYFCNLVPVLSPWCTWRAGLRVEFFWGLSGHSMKPFRMNDMGIEEALFVTQGMLYLGMYSYQPCINSQSYSFSSYRWSMKLGRRLTPYT
jgi:hypothetical protein